MVRRVGAHASPCAQGRTQTAAMLRAVTEEISTATAELALTLRNLRLTQAQASKLARTLTELAEGLRDAGDGEPRYGLLLSLYRPWQASPAPGETASG